MMPDWYYTDPFTRFERLRAMTDDELRTAGQDLLDVKFREPGKFSILTEIRGFLEVIDNIFVQRLEASER